ncbi:MAG TPA: adenylate/guanylate cyclase domain-containing protein [Actinomycetota bacterium]|nr:adenylate/guanylate cyclase domain-containing protein [Actinomycetota bacterium]
MDAVVDVVCPRCGSPNPPGFRFCGSCGTALDGATGGGATVDVDREERKVVTALFADLAASTEMASRLDPEDLRAVLRPFFDAMVEEIDRYGGTVEKFIGDAVVAVFGAPVAHEDDPERAVRCALAMHRRLRALNDDVAERAGGDLTMRIGVNTGEVIAHGIDEGIVTGEAVNIAARLQALADPGAVVVGDRTYRDTREAFAYQSVGDVQVKGIARALRLWRVERETAVPRAPTTEGRFVGRRHELDLLRLLFERTVRERRPNLATVVGPPGIGKSRLVREVVIALEEAGRARVVRGRCLPYGDGLTYWPLAEILKGDCAILDSDPHVEILRKANVRLGRRFPGEEGLGVTGILLSSIGVEVESDPLAGADPDAARRSIERAWQRYLESLCAEGPLVALVEDVHWGDPSLLALIERVVGAASGTALVVCTARPELFERRPDWAGGLSNATTVSLSPLTTDESSALVGHLLGADPPADVVEPILRRSEGNPFFAGELVRMMIEDGTLERSDGSWRLERALPTALPDTVQGVIASRLDLLPPAEKRAIQDAAVVGRVFWAGAVSALGAGEVDAGLDALVAKGLVREGSSSSIADERELVFHHVLTRDVAYASIPRVRRAEAHGAVGRWLEAVTTGRDEEFAEILAHHFGLAGDDERSARYAFVAGNRQRRVFAADAAIAWYGRAVEALGARDAGMRSRIALARGAAHEQLGSFADAEADYRLAESSAREAGDAVLEARALAAIAHVLWLHDRYDEGDELLPLALAAAREVGAVDVEARLLYTAGTMRFGRGAFDEALPLHAEALAIAERSGDTEGQALAHHGLCETYYFHGPVQLGLEHGRLAHRLFSSLGQRPMVAHNLYMVSWLEWLTGDSDAARTSVETSIELCREVGNRRDEAFALVDRAGILLGAGSFGLALADATRALDTARELGIRRAEMIAHIARSDVLAELLDARILESDVLASLELSDQLASRFMRSAVLGNAGLLAVLRGDLEEGSRSLDESRRVAGDMYVDIGWPARAEVLSAEVSGDAERLEGIAASLARLGDAPPFTLWGTYGTALAALLREDHEQAYVRALEAVEGAVRAKLERVRWRASRVAWLAAEALGRGDEAADHLRSARASVETFAASIPEDLRTSFLARPDVTELLRAP